MNGDDPHDHENDDPPEAPDTPLDEARAPHVQDPPPDNGTKGPYVV